MTALLVLWFALPILVGIATWFTPSRVPGLVALHCTPEPRRPEVSMRLVRTLGFAMALMVAPLAAAPAERPDVATVAPSARTVPPLDTSAIDDAWDDIALMHTVDASWDCTPEPDMAWLLTT